MSLGFSSLPSRASDDLKAAITNVRAPIFNELDADSIEAIKTRLIEIGTILGLSDGSTASSIAKALGAQFGAESGTRMLVRVDSSNTFIRHNFAGEAPPTANDDSGDGYAIGSIWIMSKEDPWICVDATAEDARWIRVNALGAVLENTTSRTISNQDQGKTIRVTDPLGCDFQITAGAGLRPGMRFEVVSLTDGVVGFTGDDMDAIVPRQKTARLRAYGSRATIEVNEDGTKFYVDGDLADNVVVATAISSAQNNYAPGRDAKVVYLTQSTGAAINITGLSMEQFDGMEVWLVNRAGIGPDQSFWLTEEDAASTAANRFKTPGGNATQIYNGGAALVRYDGSTSRWRSLAYVAAF